MTQARLVIPAVKEIVYGRSTWISREKRITHDMKLEQRLYIGWLTYLYCISFSPDDK